VPDSETKERNTTNQGQGTTTKIRMVSCSRVQDGRSALENVNPLPTLFIPPAQATRRRKTTSLQNTTPIGYSAPNNEAKTSTPIKTLPGQELKKSRELSEIYPNMLEFE